MREQVLQAGAGLAGVFDRAAATFDRVGPRHFSHFGKRLVERARLAPGASVLDVAMGRGAVTFPAAKRVGPHGRVTGIDISAVMLRETAAEMRGMEWPNVELRQMDAEHLQFPQATFDCVLCGFALWFFPQPHRVLQEFLRVLKPGGRLGLTTLAKDSPIHELRRQTYVPPASKVADRAQTLRFDTKEQLEAALLDVGFERPEVVAEDHEFIFATEDLLWEELWSTGARRFLEQMTAPALEHAKADLYRRLQTIRQPDGIHAVYRTLFAFACRP